MFENYPDVVTPKDVMEMIKAGRNNVYKLLQENKIKSFKIGKNYKIPKKYVIDFILDDISS